MIDCYNLNLYLEAYSVWKSPNILSNLYLAFVQSGAFLQPIQSLILLTLLNAACDMSHLDSLRGFIESRTVLSLFICCLYLTNPSI